MTAFNEIGFFAVFTLALVQMWFSVNIGFGTNLLYGSYLPDDTNIVKSAIIVPIADHVRGPAGRPCRDARRVCL